MSQPASPAPPESAAQTDTGDSAVMHAAEQFLHLARLVHGGEQPPEAQSLTPAQWMALRYFARANRLSRTPSAFSEFHATTRGTASQVVKSLIKAGLLARKTNQADGRSALIEVTAAGQAQLRHDPITAMGDAIEALPAEAREAFTRSLAKIGVALARQRRGPIFGNCADCSHCDRSQPEAPWCHCMQTPIERDEMAAICVDFSPGAHRAG